MTFIDQRFPTAIERGAQRIDDDPVEIVKTDGGREIRNLRHSQSLLEFTISFADGKLATAPVIQAVRRMFKVARGSWLAFRFRDWTDCQLTDEVIGVGDGVDTTFQIKRSWTLDGQTTERLITRPCETPAPVVKKDGVVQTSGYVIDFDTGIITFTPAPTIGHAIAVTLEFDVPVRFDAALNSGLANFGAERLDGVTLMEVKE